jgi:hypothetical protein
LDKAPSFGSKTTPILPIITLAFSDANNACFSHSIQTSARKPDPKGEFSSKIVMPESDPYIPIAEAEKNISGDQTSNFLRSITSRDPSSVFQGKG